MSQWVMDPGSLAPDWRRYSLHVPAARHESVPVHVRCLCQTPHQVMVAVVVLVHVTSKRDGSRSTASRSSERVLVAP